MIARQREKYSDSRALTSSGSRFSESVVKPTRSANSTLTSRRSGATAGTGSGGLASASAFPHDGQNLSPSPTSAPQDAQVRPSCAPHWPQKACSGCTAAPHAEQELMVRKATPAGAQRRGPAVAGRPASHGPPGAPQP